MKTASMLLALVVIVTLLFFCFCSSLAEAQQVDLANWMSKLPDNVKARPIRQLILMGSHDSGADVEYKLRYDVTPKDQSTSAFNDITKIMTSCNKSKLDQLACDIVSPIVSEVTHTQRWNFLNQLRNGIRAFDLRLVWVPKLQEFWISHSFVIQPLSLALSQFSTFLEAHPGEALFVQAEYDYEFRTESQSYAFTALKMLQKTFGPHLVKAKTASLPKLTLASLQKSGQRVFLSFDESFEGHRDEFPDFFESGFFRGYWSNTQNVTECVAYVFKYMSSHNFDSPNNIQSVSWTITADTQSIVRDLVADVWKYQLKNTSNLSVRWNAEMLRPHAIELTERWLIGRSRDNRFTILYSDWSNAEYISTVVNWNLKF